MGESENKLATVTFIDLETGDELCSFDTSPLDIAPNISADAELTYYTQRSLSFTLSDFELNREVWDKLIVGNPRNVTTEFDGYIPSLVQARTHKKKRINKKWLKRYGMKFGYKKIHGKMLECKADSFQDRIELTSSKCILEL